MLRTIIKASENFCIHQIREPYEILDGINQKRTLIAYIDIATNDNREYRVYLACELSFVQKISKIFLEEDIIEEEALIDMALETSNLIIGSAKVIAEEADKDTFSIGTPHFEKIDKFDFEYDEAKIIKIENDEMIIAIKELNA